MNVFCSNNTTHLSRERTVMTVSITNWHTAGGKLGDIAEVCEAFQRGDQPEKIDHLTLEQIKEVYQTATAIVDFCAASLRKRTAPVEFRDHETYRYAQSYAKTLSRVLLRHNGLTAEDMIGLQQWLDRLPSLPTIRIEYV